MMKYIFLEEMHKKTTQINPSHDDPQILEYKDFTRIQITTTTVVLMVLMYSSHLISIRLDDVELKLTYINYIAVPSLVLITLLLVLFMCLKRHRKCHEVITWLIFFIFYSLQVSVIVYTIINSRDEYIEIQGITVLLLTTFYLICFLKLNYVCIGVISLLNLGLLIFLQIYKNANTKFGHLYIIEITHTVIVPVGCVIARYHLDKIFSIINSSLKLNKSILNYTDSVLDELPCFYMAMSEDKIVYTNNPMQEFLDNNMPPTESNITELRLFTTNENGILIPDSTTNNNNNNYNNTNFCFNITANININANANANVNTNANKEKNQDESLAREYLTQTKMIFIEQEIATLLNLDQNNNEGRGESNLNQSTRIHTTNHSYQINLLQIISMIERSSLKNNEGVYNKFSDGKFHFIGLNEFCNNRSGVKFTHQVSCRKVLLSECSWIEIQMTDVTISQKIKNVEANYKIREDILAKIAHEFKTPLICVASLSEELEGSIQSYNIPNQLKSKLSHVKDLSNYSLYLTNDIMAYLKNLASDNIRFKFESFKLKEIIEFCYSILQTLLIYNKDKIQYIEPVLHLDADVEIKTDGLRLKQVLLNLISNAVKFTKFGIIKIKTEIVENELVISVEDTGMGIREEDFKKVFKEEKMLDDHLDVNPMGSGLGLNISYQLTKSLKGKLSFTSKFGEGSNFFITFPESNYYFLTDPNNITMEAQYNNNTRIIAKKRKTNSMSNFHSLFKLRSDREEGGANCTDPSPNNNNFFINPLNQINTNGHIRNYSSQLSNSISPLSPRFHKFNTKKNNFLKLNLNDNSIHDTSNNIFLIEKEDTLLDRTITTNALIDIHLTISESKKLSVYSKDEDIYTTFNRPIINSLMFNSNPTNTLQILRRAILIVDDTSLFLTSLERMINTTLASLEIYDIEVIKGFDGVDMLKTIMNDQKMNNKILFTIVDEKMEYLDGSEVMKIIRKMERENRIKKQIIFRSSADSPVDFVYKEEGSGDGFDNHFPKPMSAFIFKEFIIKFLNLEIE